jgi:hypothetical protein
LFSSSFYWKENRIVYEWLDLLNKFINNPLALLRKNRSRTASSSATPLTNKPFALASSNTIIMAKSLRDYSTPTIANMPVGPVSILGMETSSSVLASSR